MTLDLGIVHAIVYGSYFEWHRSLVLSGRPSYSKETRFWASVRNFYLSFPKEMPVLQDPDHPTALKFEILAKCSTTKARASNSRITVILGNTYHLALRPVHCTVMPFGEQSKCITGTRPVGQGWRASQVHELAPRNVD
jgi:hypothetical protein